MRLHHRHIVSNIFIKVAKHIVFFSLLSGFSSFVVLFFSHPIALHIIHNNAHGMWRNIKKSEGNLGSCDKKFLIAFN